jgi:PTH2 family peptidyl-tRNA hydrolase
LKVGDESALFHHAQMAKDAGLSTTIITDAGKTVIAPGTVTCCGIGPAEEAMIDTITGKLPMY